MSSPASAGRDDPDRAGPSGAPMPGAGRASRPGSIQPLAAVRPDARPAGSSRASASVRPWPPAGQSARRIVTTATIGTRIPSCGLMSAAITVQIAARSGWSRQSSRTPSRRKTTPNESTWPQTTESNQLTGLATAITAARSAARRPAPSSLAIDQTSQPIATSAKIAGSLIRSPMPPAAWPNEADEVEHEEVAGRVVVEAGPLVEAVEAVRGEVAGPSPEGGEIERPARSRGMRMR